MGESGRWLVPSQGIPGPIYPTDLGYLRLAPAALSPSSKAEAAKPLHPHMYPEEIRLSKMSEYLAAISMSAAVYSSVHNLDLECRFGSPICVGAGADSIIWPPNILQLPSFWVFRFLASLTFATN
ncbi:unnamed protein product [Caenorhabditis auriculariae]|uniref:Uncharacterized protein n=1 Tax=Caenorhabditis auriculariae TaxID=2777116 RepID=A0A8S1HTM0_9PELO|nr:unnamed protein product [Caenorhabditis auriculariae]